MENKTRPTLDEYAKTFIRLKAQKLLGKYGFTSSDREDIEQELTLDLLTRLSKFNHSKGRLATFVRVVVDRRVASLIRERTSQSRDYRRTTNSLEELTDERGEGTLTEPSYDDQDQQALAIDIADAMSSLPEDLRTLAEELRVMPLTQVARRHGCTREVMRRKAREIRGHIAERGLDDYASPPPRTHSAA